MLLSRWALVVFIALSLGGCATKKIDWASLVGNYTYDQAIVELGPPDKAAQLSDGTTIADWYQRRSGPSFGVGTGVSSGSVGVGVGVPIGGGGYRVLRLSFDREGVLRSFAR